MGDSMKHKAEEALGKAKAGVGDASDDERLEAEGRREEKGAQLKQAGDKVEDAAKD